MDVCIQCVYVVAGKCMCLCVGLCIVVCIDACTCLFSVLSYIHVIYVCILCSMYVGMHVCMHTLYALYVCMYTV